MERITLFADVVLPLAVPQLYTYRVPYEWNALIQPGQRVVVQFGRSKLYTALVRSVHENAPKQYASKYIDHILDTHPIVNEKQFRLWEWMASYYMCTIGEVMNAALPSGLKLASETRILLNPAFGNAYDTLSDKEYLVVEALEVRNSLTLDEVAEIVELRTVYPLIKTLIAKGAVLIHEELKERYKPRTETYVRFTEHADNEDNLQEVFRQLEKKAFKQLEAVMTYIRLSDRYAKKRNEVKKSALMKEGNISAGVITELEKKNVFELYDKEVGRLADAEKEGDVKELSEYQQEAFAKLKNTFENKDIALLHGVTSSGKTEVYVRLIEETIAQGKQVLYLLPEIALTTQIINRLRKYFGERVGVYHSRFSENERVEVWNNVIGEAKYDVVLGARSALFLPFTNIGLVIVDEEHDTSYKQYDPAPRYNARDTAIYLAHIHSAKTLLGSATPSVESYYNAQAGKYGFVEMMKRFGGVQMPEVLVADVKEDTRKKKMKSHFSPLLMEHIQLALENKEQVILFQNRRGFSPMMECSTCAWTPQCTQCDVTLTYHKAGNQLRCHYCGYSVKPPTACAACGDTKLQTKGFGTEKIEEELAIYYPSARISRMDLDTTRSKFAYQQIIHDFEEQNVDILVGTQMVTKGLDFDNVSVVGILNADSMMNFPDFRSYERSFQLMAQVAGRAGRKSKRGKVIIQTFNPTHSVIQSVIRNDYITMYTDQLTDRRNFHYPPFHRLIAFTLWHKDQDVLNNSSKHFADELRLQFGKRVLGPEFPPVARIRNMYRKNILLKLEKESSHARAKQVIHELLEKFKADPDHKSIKVQVDVDPV
jgi:primosomal protein N' (replication factor Y) (superfamily II helicase)